MSTKSNRSPKSPVVPSEKAVTELQEAVLRVEHFSAAQLLWDRVLTPGERKRLKGDLPTAYQQCGSTAGIWCELRGGCGKNAVIEINHKLGLMNDMTREWLRREFGLSDAKTTPECHLEWCNKTGELRLNNEVIRKIRRGVSKNVDVVLDAFQEEDWRQHIDNPLADSSDRLRETVRSLNKRLQRIRFAADGSGKGITWKLIPTT